MQTLTALAAISKQIRRFAQTEEGQDLLEYGLLIALIAVTAIGIVTTLGTTVNAVFWQPIANAF